MEALRSLTDLRHPYAFATWIRLLTRTQAARYRRAQRATPLPPLEMTQASAFAALHSTPDEAAERSHDIDVVRRALTVARSDDRLLLELRYRAEWTDRDHLAAEGRDVLFAVGRVIADRSGPGNFDVTVGTLAGAGSITGVRIAAHARDADPAPPYDRADAHCVFSLEAFVAGRHPAVDVLESSSALADGAGAAPDLARAAAAARRLLAQAAAVERYLEQPFWMAEEYTGESGIRFEPGEALAGLAEVLRV